MNEDSEPKNDALPGIQKLDRIIHEPARLMIVAYLYVVKSADYLFLKKQTGMSWGNLSTHMSKLESADYVQVEKGFVGKKTSTSVHLTDMGRAAFEEYREKLRQVVEALW